MHIGSLQATNAFDYKWLDGLHESFTDYLSSDPEYVHESMQPLQPEVEEECEFNESLAGHLHHRNIQGFAACVSTPVNKYHSETSASYSWGYTHSAWVYGESFEECFFLAKKWAEGKMEENKQKWRDSLKEEA